MLGTTRVPASQAPAPPSHSAFTGAELPQAKKCLASMYAEALWSCLNLCNTVDCGLPGFFVKGFLQARILERTGQYLFPYLSRVLYFLLPYLLSPLRTWCCQNPCNPSSCTNSTPGPHRDKPKFSREVSGANPSGPPKCRGGTNTTIET